VIERRPGRGLRISIIGLSGSGKSTGAGMIEALAAAEGLSVCRVKLARPLYALQREVYAAAGVELLEPAQDQLLMEALAEHLRRIRPDSLVADFERRLTTVTADVVLNDDLRDPHVDAPALRALGFRALRITCREEVRQGRLTGRADLSRADRSTAEIEAIEPDAVIDNSHDLDSYRRAIRRQVLAWR
jgi:dephospho-CoA kinase